MATSTTSRPTRSAASMITAGALLLLAVPLVQLVAGEFFLLALIGVLLLALALPGLSRGQGAPAGRIGRAGARLAAVSGVCLVPLSIAAEAEVPGAMWALALAGLGLLAGVIAFATAAATTRVYPRWATLALATALPLGAVGESLADIEIFDIIGVSSIIVTGISAIRLGTAAFRSPGVLQSDDSASRHTAPLRAHVESSST